MYSICKGSSSTKLKDIFVPIYTEATWDGQFQKQNDRCHILATQHK